MTDFMSKEARSRVMASIRSTGTKHEKLLGSMLHKRGLRYRKHAKDLAGRPDIVFRNTKVAIFVDGDFWHGWRLPQWEDKLDENYWRKKIRGNRERDKKNHALLRRMGWKVIRVWEHQIERNPKAVVQNIVRIYEERLCSEKQASASNNGKFFK